MKRMRVSFLAALVIALLVPESGLAAPEFQFCNTVPSDPPPYAGGDPRVREERVGVDGTRVLVAVPTDYDTSTRIYPVLWLFHGGASREDCFLIRTDLLSFTAGQPLDQQAIVAMPDGGLGSLWVDWRDGRFQDETRFIHEIVPTIEGRYRTYGDRAHRAVAGFSAGGFSATYLAARHPDIFAAYAGISGIVEMSETDAFTGPVYGPLAGLAGTAASGVPGASGPFGHPGVDSIWWHNANPIDLAPNLGGVDVTIFTGNGVPCDARDLAEASSTLPPFTLGEPLIRKWAMDLDRALTSANVTHTLDDYSGVTGCGVHTYRYAERDIHVWWNPLLASFGSQPPSSFDYRRADPVFSVWGWTLTSETTRAAEFLDVTDASASGVTLTGSGVETVTTAGYFAPGSVLALTGAVEQIASADDAGRIMFHVDLGPAHEFEQYTPQQRIFEALGGYWTTRIVSFELM